MKVSILITTYNCEASVDEAIGSAVNQQMPFEWEVLVGDDGSSDKTRQIVHRWMAEYPDRISLYVMDRDPGEEKNGTRAARNRANLLARARGDYIIFLDGDDLFLGTEKIKRQVELLDSDSLGRCSGVAHNILANDIPNKRKYPLLDESFPAGVVDSKYYWAYMYFHTNTLLFRRKCVDMMLKEEYRDYLNDNFITYIVLQYGSLYYMPELWAQYNLTGNGLWTGNKKTYGCFRNMILFDLERRINRSYRYASYVRHLQDFKYILGNYTPGDRDRVRPLVDGLSETEFPFTLLLYKADHELSDAEKAKKRNLRFIVSASVFWRIIGKIPMVLKKPFKRARG